MPEPVRQSRAGNKMRLVLVKNATGSRRACQPANLHRVGGLIVILHAGAIAQGNREIVEADTDIQGQSRVDLPLVAGVTSEIFRISVVIVRPLKYLAGVLGKSQQE